MLSNSLCELDKSPFVFAQYTVHLLYTIHGAPSSIHRSATVEFFPIFDWINLRFCIFDALAAVGLCTRGAKVIEDKRQIVHLLYTP